MGYLDCVACGTPLSDGEAFQGDLCGPCRREEEDYLPLDEDLDDFDDPSG